MDHLSEYPLKLLKQTHWLLVVTCWWYLLPLRLESVLCPVSSCPHVLASACGRNCEPCAVCLRGWGVCKCRCMCMSSSHVMTGSSWRVKYILIGDQLSMSLVAAIVTATNCCSCLLQVVAFGIKGNFESPAVTCSRRPEAVLASTVIERNPLVRSNLFSLFAQVSNLTRLLNSNPLHFVDKNAF